MTFRISDDPAELDHARIHRWILDESYWANGRARKRQDAAIAGSWNFGALVKPENGMVRIAPPAP